VHLGDTVEWWSFVAWSSVISNGILSTNSIFDTWTHLGLQSDSAVWLWKVSPDAGQMGCVNPLASANPLFRDSTYSNYRDSTVFDSAYSIRCHRVPVPREHSSDTVRLQYVLHKLTSQNFSMVRVT